MVATASRLTFHRFRQIARPVGLAILILGGGLQMASEARAGSGSVLEHQRTECATSSVNVEVHGSDSALVEAHEPAQPAADTTSSADDRC